MTQAFWGGLGDIAGYAASQLMPTGWTIGAVVLVIAVLVVLGRGESWRLPVPAAFAMGGILLAVTLSCMSPGLMQSAVLRLEGSAATQLQRNQKMGVVLGLYAAWSNRLEQEQMTTEESVAALMEQFRSEEAQPAPVALDQVPDIVFITSESFFDLTRLPGLTFAQDPLPVYHALAETGTNGRFLSNTYGGGTGNVEMELLTGLSSAALKEGDTITTLPSEVYPTLPSLPRLMKQVGYDTMAVHSHNNTLYRRAEIYPAVGFDQMLFIDNFMTQPEMDGPYTSDASFARELIARYEARDPSKPFFLYGLSMENHQGYTPEKYAYDSGFSPQADALNQTDLDILDSLVIGLNHADASLGMLVDYFSQVDRPVMLVFLGDHLPSLNLENGDTLYQRLGVVPEKGGEESAESMFELLTTDYLVWTNYETQPVPDRTDSCSMLGLHVLQQAGIPLDPYFSWLASVEPQLLLYRSGLYVDPAGEPTFAVPEETQAMLDWYTAVQRSVVYHP